MVLALSKGLEPHKKLVQKCFTPTIKPSLDMAAILEKITNWKEEKTIIRASLRTLTNFLKKSPDDHHVIFFLLGLMRRV